MQRRPQCNDSFNFHSYSFIYLCIYLSIYLLYHFIVVLIQRRHVAISDNFVFQFIHTTAHSINWTLPPNTLHPTPYTLHPTPYTLHPTPYPAQALLFHGTFSPDPLTRSIVGPAADELLNLPGARMRKSALKVTTRLRCGHIWGHI